MNNNSLPPNYELHPSGAWHQKALIKSPIKYDAKYVAYYDTLDCDSMSRIRWNIIKQWCKPASIVLDYGCGNGSFVRMLQSCETKPTVYGWDIADYGPKDVVFCEPSFKLWDVVTFFDSLEHLIDPEAVIKSLNTKYIVISLPWNHGPRLGIDWFMSWKHRKDDEHLWYFDAQSLISFMKSCGYGLKYVGNPEDVIRKPVIGSDLPNILTGIFIKQ